TQWELIEIAADRLLGYGAQRPLALRRYLAAVAVTRARGTTLHHGRMRPLGRGKHGAVEDGRVVRTEHARATTGDGQVDERFVPYSLPNLFAAASRPYGLADVVKRLPAQLSAQPIDDGQDAT